ncbi:DNA polymerase I, partial [Candidatus Gottesmanbacteria bacterium]|nr:DNA polymerase I [Candidatus Gottesmanbacteria bacterium]
MENVKLVLIDGHAVLHRAFHALPPLTNKDRVQTNAVYGFVTMLLRILDDLQPTHLAVAFDLPQPTFRKQQYVGYQAKRPVMQSNLAEQIPLVHELFDKLNIRYFEIASFEADDVIGTIATKTNVETIIITGDRDMLQLINKNIKVCVSETKIYDEDLVKKEFGVLPSQWVDVKALKGDSSDNYPGVRGIGPKTAEKLISQYETLENLYKNLG